MKMGRGGSLVRDEKRVAPVMLFQRCTCIGCRSGTNLDERIVRRPLMYMPLFLSSQQVASIPRRLNPTSGLSGIRGKERKVFVFRLSSLVATRQGTLDEAAAARCAPHFQEQTADTRKLSFIDHARTRTPAPLKQLKK